MNQELNYKLEIRFVIQTTHLGLLFYTIFLKLYPVGIRIASLWNDKASLWIKGRKNIFEKAGAILSDNKENAPVIWMHCASLGEFEQGRPLIEKIRSAYPMYQVVISFFSPSGYEIQKNFKGADHVFYLPQDSPSNAKKFIELIRPTLVLWIKYEFWYYYLHELKKNNIPTLLISGAFRESQPFFKSYGRFWRKMLTYFSYYFVQNEPSKILLEDITIKNVIVSGDTRFDRVIAIAESFDNVPWLKEFCGDHKVIVAGSTWEDDEAELIHYAKANQHIKFIIAPHEIDKENLRDVKKEFHGSIFYSELDENTMQNTNTIIIDNIGMLSRLYKYAHIAYVGGGFGYDGLHNILEAAVYGRPVLFGPEVDKNFEAAELMEWGGGMIIKNALELENILTRLFGDEAELKQRGAAAKNYVYSNAGATKKIMEYIQENRLLTN